jgi:hypothetical protein
MLGILFTALIYREIGNGPEAIIADVVASEYREGAFSVNQVHVPIL